METRLLRAPEDLDEAASILKGGGLVAFPTETVYGLGARGLDPRAVARIFAAKERPHSDPVILHLGEAGWLGDLTPALPPEAEALMRRFWPGPLTLVLPRSSRVPDLVTAGGPTVAVRMPAHPVALELIRRVGEPVAAPSANLFSRPSPTRAEDVLEDLAGRIDAVLDGGPTSLGVESTVLDLSGPEPVLLRPGGVTREELEAALGSAVRSRRPAAAAGQPLPSPGLLERHYSPRAEVVLFDGRREAVLPAMAQAGAEAGTRVLAFSEDLPPLGGLPEVVELGSAHDPGAVAARLYAAFRAADRDGMRRIVVRALPPEGLGEAVNDRLRRAACGVVHHLQ